MGFSYYKTSKITEEIISPAPNIGPLGPPSVPFIPEQDTTPPQSPRPAEVPS